MTTKRLFLALPLPAVVQQELSGISQLISHNGLRWTPPENLHITLLFLGNVPEKDIPQMIQHLLPLAETKVFSLKGHSVKAISRRGSTSMIWATFEPSASFKNLAESVAAALQHLPDHEPLPHITLARAKRDFRGKLHDTRWPQLEHLRLPISGFELWESVLRPQGAQYQPLHRFTLAEC